MSFGVFTDKSQRPSKAEIETALGKAAGLWESLIHYIRSQFSVKEDFSFLYGKKYGWALRFRIKDKLLACIYPNTNYFITQIILNTQNLSDTSINSLHANASKAIEIAKLYSEGKWLFMRTQTNRDINDIKILLNLKTQKKQKNLKM